MESVTQERKLGLIHATAINMIDMVGIGPFITLPMVISTINGPYFLYAWIAGAILSMVDATVWSELGAAFPRAGGSYNFLKEAYGSGGLGKLVSFLFVWQTLIQAPLVIASAAIGFSDYFSYLIELTPFSTKLLSGGVVISIVILLFRRVESIGRISVLLWGIVLGTLFWIIAGGVVHGNFFSPLKEINKGFHFSYAFVALLGSASVKSVYSYLGYYNICHLGGEISNPAKNIPRSMYLSIIGIALLYILMNISVVSVIPWNEAKDSKFVISLFMEELIGPKAAMLTTCLILVVAFSSVFSATLGYSRIPYAAASDGAFFKIFARVHPQGNFPYVSILFLGGLAFLFSLMFKLSDVISAILAMRILIQFIGQAIGLLILHKKRSVNFPFNMPFYPWPIYLGIVMWIGLLCATGLEMLLGALFAITIGSLVYMVKARISKEWPFSSKESSSGYEP